MDINKLTINNIRVLCAEMIDAADSGHPGLPLGCAGIGYALYSEVLKHNPKNDKFFDRDRFVLSAGHGSALLYSLLHIFGYGLEMGDIKKFRQMGSVAAGHPEYRHIKGIEASTGPLGQGIANAVGMSIAESMLAAKFNKEDIKLIDHYTYALCGDGCMMEGIESEAASLAGTLKLGKLIIIYDSNKITIEGSTDLAFCEDVRKRHEAQGWQVINVASGEDTDSFIKAVKKAKKETEKPSLIIVSTRIGEGSSKAGSAEIHGTPLGKAATAEMKKAMDWDYPEFTVAGEVQAHVKKLSGKFASYEKKWNKLAAEYAKKYPADYEQLQKWIAGDIGDVLDDENIWLDDKAADATRNSGGRVLNKLAALMPNIVGGAADLAPSTKTYLTGAGEYGAANRAGRNIHFGIREHAMAAISNGIALHGGLRSYCSTFHVFSDYMRNPIRMSALMKLPVLYILTHDSIGVGEDGPTHQPIEQTASLRLIPDIDICRPADYRETAAAYIGAVSGDRPTCIILSRQNLPALPGSGRGALSGGYIIDDCVGTPDVIFIATGSETHLAAEAKQMLAGENIKARVVSMPCVERFERQSAEYKSSVLPAGIKKIAVEAGRTDGWYKYTGDSGAVIGIDSFGMSGKAEKLMEHFGFTAENIAATAKKLLDK